MDRYLSIVEEHSQLAMGEVKLKQFLDQTKVWDFAKITKSNYEDMSPIIVLLFYKTIEVIWIKIQCKVLYFFSLFFF